jgi:hypothetical protein
MTSPKLASDEGVVLTMNSMSSPGKRARTQSTHARSSSLTMTASGATRAAMRFRMTVSISGTPATGTMGLGITNPL